MNTTARISLFLTAGFLLSFLHSSLSPIPPQIIPTLNSLFVHLGWHNPECVVSIPIPYSNGHRTLLLAGSYIFDWNPHTPGGLWGIFLPPSSPLSAPSDWLAFSSQTPRELLGSPPWPTSPLFYGTPLPLPTPSSSIPVHGVTVRVDSPGSLLVAFSTHLPFRESVELFRLHYNHTATPDITSFSCEHTGTYFVGHAVDDVVFRENTIIASVFLPTLWGKRAAIHALRGLIGLNTGSVLVAALEPGAEMQNIPRSKGSGPNGVDVSGNKLYCAETFSGRIVEYLSTESGYQRTGVALSLPGHYRPDNILVDGDRLWVAAHHGAVRLGLGMATGIFTQPFCRSGWGVFSFNTTTGARERLQIEGENQIGAVSSVAFDKGSGCFILGSLISDRIALLCS